MVGALESALHSPVTTVISGQGIHPPTANSPHVLGFLTPFSMVLVWQMVPSAAGMLLVMQRLLLLRHHNSLQTSWKEKDFGGERGREEERDKDMETGQDSPRPGATRLGQCSKSPPQGWGCFLYWAFIAEAKHKDPSCSTHHEHPPARWVQVCFRGKLRLLENASVAHKASHYICHFLPA